ncbi:MAG: wax ester/triacylglycerol synthase family O-acyltransferase [Ilumatobacteraceae bacterium]
MKQLSGIDVSFLNMETASVFGHVSSLNLYDPTGVPGGAGLEATKQIILERIDQLAPFRRRLVEVPLGLDLPYWIEDPEFDIDFHVRHHAVPPPGTPEQLAEVVSRIVARPLDRNRPLWELYVIEGVDGGRLIAQLTKVHHATIDGAAGAQMLAAILDTDPDFRPVGSPAPWTPDKVPTDDEMLRITMLEYLKRPEKFVRLSVRSTRELAAATRSRWLRARRSDRAADARPGRAVDAPAAAGPVGPRRRPGSGAPADAGTAHPVEPSDHTAPPLRLHECVARRRQGRAPSVRLHVQRRGDGAVQRHAAALPRQARLPARGEPDRDGAGQRAHGGRGRHVPEPGRPCSPIWPPTSPTPNGGCVGCSRA